MPGHGKRVCEECKKAVSRNNFARHQRKHDETNRKDCHYCQTKIYEQGWKRHIESQSHKNKVNHYKKQQTLPVDQLPGPQLQLEAHITVTPQDGSVGSLVRDFLHTTGGPLSPLASAYAKEIVRTGGLSGLQPEGDTELTRIWAGLGLRPPMLFPAAECWQKKPPPDDYYTDLLQGFSKRETQVYSRGKPFNPIVPPPFREVLRQLDRPDPSSTKYAINMLADSVEVRIPERLLGLVPAYLDSDIITTTNVTPKFSAAELHVDHGKHGVTLLYGGCVKLWALYPLTPYNLERFSTARGSDVAFIQLQGQLEGGKFCVQTEDQAIYLPPGCVHSTFTLQGGLTPGIEFSTVECLEPAAKMLDLNLKGLGLCGNDYYPLLEAIIMGLRSERQDQQEKAMEVLCPKYRKVRTVNPGILPKVKRQLPKYCSKCNALWGKH
ncbi:hypothetical protein F4778DRAFT_729069 [Xylariomycetidae sp. FL2044]|nr:hypothetical protein F4778DRAFT_729069 [Xylariomycetidae sp. FL2044]